MTSDPHQCFLVTSVGAYADSGLGTGGFTCVHQGRSTVIDKADSTALFQADGLVFRFARSLRSLIGYDAEGVRQVIRMEDWKDMHDVLLINGEFVCVSTGTNEVVWLDHFGRLLRRQKFPGDGDAWHLNCLWETAGKLFLSAFGRFDEHRGWKGKAVEAGFIIDLETGREIFPKLSCPHNPRFIDGDWVVCNSWGKTVLIQKPGGEVVTINLKGFTRGLAFDERFFYVGESADRKAEAPSNCSYVVTLDRRTLEEVGRIEIPFPEIYELIMISPELSQKMAAEPEKFQVYKANEHITALEEQVEMGLREIEALKAKLEKWKRRKGLSQALSDIKKMILGQGATKE